MQDRADGYRIAANELRDFVARAFVHAGSSEPEARIVGDHLVDANLAGHDSHGVIRVAKYSTGMREAWCWPTSTRGSNANPLRTPSSTAASATAR
jgi:LDH2 family malate/lactate/ureidoglycolate dehydrogenase